MQKKSSSFCKATVASVTGQNKELGTCLEPFPAMLPRHLQTLFSRQQLRLSERLAIQFIKNNAFLADIREEVVALLQFRVHLAQ